jgi:hypothetical protein
MIYLTINGANYPATNNGDGTWILPVGMITPALDPGAYDVGIAINDTGESINSTSQRGVTVDPAAPTGTVAPVTSNNPAPQLQGTVSQPDTTIELTIGAMSYPATNNRDGTWTLPASTINPTLAPGTYDVTLVLRSPDGHVSVQTIHKSIEITSSTVIIQQTYPVNPNDFEPLPLLPIDSPQISDPALYPSAITPSTVITPQPSQSTSSTGATKSSGDAGPLSLPKVIGTQIAKHVSEASPNTVATTVTGTGIALVGTPWALVAWRRRRKKNSQTSYLS